MLPVNETEVSPFEDRAAIGYDNVKTLEGLRC